METRKPITIVTHSGGFHADDVFAVATLLLVHANKDVEIMRTRDRENIDRADYVVDVGFEYDPKRNRFDHHQEQGAGVRENGIAYASFGLVWKQFGETLTQNKHVSERLDTILVQSIDGPDTGTLLSKPVIDGLWPYTINFAITSFEPAWGSSEEQLHARFVEAVALAQTIIKNEIARITQEENAREHVKEVYEKSSDKRLIDFEGARGWSRVFLSIALTEYPEPLFFIRQHYDHTWQLVAVQEPGYVLRRPLPASWAGKTDDELARVTGVRGARFCHKERFMCIAETKEGALALAKLALEA